MAHLDDVRIFTVVVKAGSFTQAARELGLQKSSVSRRVSELEERLGTRLLQRTTRTLRLTEEGELYHARCARAVADLEEAEQALFGRRATPRGVLRVTAPLSFGFLGQPVAEYLERHREVQVELHCTDRVVDVVEEGFDVAVRAGVLRDSTLIARKLGEQPRFLVASPRYLSRKGRPKVPEDLARHACIAFGPKLRTVWRLVQEGSGEEVEVALDARLSVNDFELVREAAQAGLGVALVPEPNCAEALKEGGLERVLPRWSAPTVPIHAVYPSSRHLSAKVKGFVDGLHRRLGPPGGRRR